MEQWRDIPGFETRYQASDLGRVRSLDRFVRSRGGQRKVRGQILKPQRHIEGYLQINLDRRTFTVGPLVLSAFKGPCPKGMECAHGNGDKRDNVPTNLRWATPLSNANDRRLHGTSGRGERNATAKLTAAIAVAIRSDTRPQLDIAAEFGIAQSTVSKIKLGQRWAHV